MDKEKKIREPFKPEDTPNPPQIIDPEVRAGRKDPDAEKKQKSSGPPDKTGKPGSLSDRAEIDDETTR